MNENDLNSVEDMISQIKQVMEDKKISSYKLGQMTGLTPANIRRLLTSWQAPNLKTIVLICNKLEIKINLVW